MKDDLISRQAAIEAVNGMPDCPNGFSGTYDKAAIIGILEDVPSVEELKSEALETAYLEGYTAGQNAQPKYVALHESCTDCPLYDRKNYNCPRFNRVIPMAIRDAQTQVKALSLPSAQPDDWMERNKERILQAGMEGREIEFRIGGRLFAIREKAQ